MPRKKQLVADPISKVRLLDTNAVVGWVYRWNNGDVRVMWREQEHSAIFYDPVAQDQDEDRGNVPLQDPHRSPEPRFA